MTLHDNDQLLMLRKFPLLLPANHQCTLYEGFLQAGKEDFHISISVPQYPLLTDITLNTSWELNYLLSGYQREVQELSRCCSSLPLYLEHLKNMIVSSLKNRSLPMRYNDYINGESLKRIMSDLENIGMENCIFLSSSLTKLKLKVIDESQYCHVISIDLGSNYPCHGKKIQADLPQHALQNIEENSSLAGIYRSFVKQVSSLQNTWTILDDLDAKCWILDPEYPSKKDVYRRLVIGENVSVHLTLDPEDITSRPILKFLGPEQAVQPFQLHFAENLEEWLAENSFIDNLKCVLGIGFFPVCPSSQSKDIGGLVHEGECCICYAFKLDGEVPSEMCNSVSCGSIFHNDCLFQWLQTVPGNYQSFNRIHGECPNCSMAISCLLPANS